MRARRFAALAAGIPAVLAVPALATVDVGEVTIRARLFFDPGTAMRKVEISGTIATPAAGEVVDVQAKECGPSSGFYRLIGGTRSIGGGTWQLDPTQRGVDLYMVPINSYFRARWNGKYSEPVLVRIPISVWATWRPRRRAVDVLVDTAMTGQSLHRRFVELQRKVEGTDQWMRVRRAQLRRAGVRRGVHGFATRFGVPTRGLTLRILVPGTTAAPCFGAGVSESFTS